MFETSFLEMLVIGIVALLVIGPERLPTVARTVGLWIGKARRLIAHTRADIERELGTEELRSMLYKQEEELRNLRVLMNDQVDTAKKEIETHVKSD